MFRIPKTMDPEEYKKEYLQGLHPSSYNDCRFAADKLAYAKKWLDENVPTANYEEPRTIIDRICHYKLYDKDPRKAFWADKINAIHELRSMGMSELIIEPVLYSRSYLSDEDFASLPEGKYILRMNHGSGWNMVFNKTANFDPTYLQHKVWEWYNLNFAYITGYEWQYEHIVPGFVIQPYLGELMNWEFWCENGNIVTINLQRKANKNIEQMIAWFDENGNPPSWQLCEGIYNKTWNVYTKSMLEQMKPYVKRLASDFKFVRVDLYGINNTVKFSELTFTPSSGRLKKQGIDYE